MVLKVIIKENQCLKLSIVGIVLLIASFFLFYNRGHYALWDDEETTALFGQLVTLIVKYPTKEVRNLSVETQGVYVFRREQTR